MVKNNVNAYGHVCECLIAGKPLTMEEADDHIFGLVLMNDWSARY